MGALPFPAGPSQIVIGIPRLAHPIWIATLRNRIRKIIPSLAAGNWCTRCIPQLGPLHQQPYYFQR